MRTPLIVGFASLTFGAVMVMFGSWLIARARIRARSWRQISARVVNTSLESRVNGAGVEMFFGSYIVNYTAGGVSRQGRVTLTVGDGSPAEAENRLASHPLGARISIAHHPADPDKIVLKDCLNASWSHAGAGLIGLGLMFSMVGGAILMWKSL